MKTDLSNQVKTQLVLGSILKKAEILIHIYNIWDTVEAAFRSPILRDSNISKGGRRFCPFVLLFFFVGLLDFLSSTLFSLPIQISLLLECWRSDEVGPEEAILWAKLT